MQKISLIMVCYNAERYIDQSIRSILSQKYDNLEYIIIDGGSTDSTCDIIKRYADHISAFISEPDDGMYHALKKGFELATGDILGWLNSDDILLPGALLNVNAIFQQDENISWMTGSPVLMSDDGKLFPRMDHHITRLYKRFEYLNGPIYCIQQESTFFTKELYDSVGGISTEYTLAGDYELWCRFFQKTELHVCDALIGAFRSHAAQQSQDKKNYFSEVKLIRSRYTDKACANEYKRYRLIQNIFKLAPSFLSRRLLSRISGVKYCYEKSTNRYKRTQK